MCSHSMANLLYDKLKAACEAHVKETIPQFLGYPFLNKVNLFVVLVLLVA